MRVSVVDDRRALYTITGSHACLVAELMLRHKRLAYRRRVVPPGVHRVVVRRRDFAAGTVPALLIGAERVQGTRAISRALDALQPDPPLFPRDPQRRRAVEEAERRGEEFQDAVRRIFYCSARRRPSVAGSVLGAGLSPVRAAALRAVLPVFVRAAASAHGATDAACRRDLAQLPAMLDEVDAWIADGTIGGPAAQRGRLPDRRLPASPALRRRPRRARRRPAVGAAHASDRT